MPQVTVGNSLVTNDDPSIVVRGKAWSGWTDVRITRGLERCPADFEIHLTEFSPGEVSIEVQRGDACELMIGPDVVLAGFVERIVRTLGVRQHTITLAGRSKCSDLVDCSAEWPGGQIIGSSVLDIATKLAAPYGISVSAPGSVGPAIPQFNLSRGESPFQIIERLCRFGQLLCYDLPDGSLILTVASTVDAASGFTEGVNILDASFAATVDQRFSEYLSYQQSVATLDDLGAGGDLQATVFDELVPRHRRKILISETSGGIGWQIAQQRAGWEAQRRRGRSNEVRIKTDAWRDSLGNLYAPNTRALVTSPTLTLNGVQLTISEVTYRRGEDGTTCDLVLMPAEAFTPQPFNVAQLVPIVELAGMAIAPPTK